MSNVSDVMKRIKKDYGASTAMMGHETYMDTPRLPTGIFPFDLASGGGFPMGRVSVVFGPESSGKCHAKGTKVLMYDGSLKNVEDLVAGDQVMGVDSTPRTVQQVGTGYGKLYRITPVKGNDPFIINGEHVLSLVCTHDQGNRKKGDVVNISLNDYMQQSRDWKIYHHLYRVPVEFAERKVPLSPYFLGLWLGDGHSNRPVITTADEPIVDWLQGFADKHGWELRTYTANFRCPMYGVVGERQGNANERYLVPMDHLRRLDVIDNKHVPELYKINSREVRLEVLAGLLDSDGNKGTSGSMEFANTNKRLCEDVLFLARSLGLYASMTEVNSTYEGESYTHFKVYLSGDFSDVPLQLERKRPPQRKRSGSPLTSRFTIEELEEDTYYGFMLDGDHLYLLDSFIVNHNTNVVLKAIGQGQRIYPDKYAVFVDAEHAFDPDWAATLGVDTEKLIVVHPEYAEQAVDMIEAFLYAGDVFVVALDSIAALSTQNEIESSAEKASVGGASLVIGKLFKKATVSFNRMRNQGLMPPAFIGINQIRHKIGVMYGDPECVHADTLVNFVDGRSIPIRQVVEQKIDAPIWAFNEDTGQFFESKILSHHYNGEAKDGDFLVVSAQGVDTKNGVFSATVTYTHKFLTFNGWKTAGELEVGELLLTKYRSVISGTLKDFLAGALCGDATLFKPNAGLNCGLKFQDRQNPEYAAWKASLLAPFFSVTGADGKFVVSPTYDLGKFGEQFGGCRHPQGLFNNFSWLGFAVWIMDDGHYSRDRYTLSVGRFKDDEQTKEYLSECLDGLGLDHSWNGKNVVFSVSASKEIAVKCREYAPDCMSYKFPEQVASTGTVLCLKNNGVQYLATYTPVTSVVQASSRKYRDRGLYDLHIEGHHNYLAGNMDNGFVVHNTMPGGNAIKFASSFTVRLYGKNVLDKKIHPVLPAYKETNIIIRKWKVPINATTALYNMQMIPFGGTKPGHVEDWPTMKAYLTELDYLGKGEKGGWVLFGNQYKTLDEVKAALYADPDTLAEAQASIITECLSKVEAPAEDDAAEAEDSGPDEGL